ncbi:MAG TPA: hypothetical protein VMG38_09985 [Trebonia sp.]|nr:hypothetical protein [Trebonia sp.]
MALRTPGRLRALLLASVAVSLVWGAVSAWTVEQRQSAANQVVAGSGPLSYDAQQVYQSLSDADATEANGYLSAIEPASDVTRIHADISRAEAYVLAIRAGDQDPAIQADLTTLATGIPSYTDYVGEADAFNRGGQPVGAAWLSDASYLMRHTLLPAASDMYASENARLNAAYARATGFPFLAVGAAIVFCLLAVAAQYRLARRTNRLLNPGLAAASLIGLVSLAWLLGSLGAARSGLLAGRDQGSAPAQFLVQAEVTALRMHSDESLTLINRDGADDSTEKEFKQALWPLLGRELVSAQSVGAGSPGEADAAAAARAAQAWYGQHQRVYDANRDGDYPTAVTLATTDSTASFRSVEAALGRGIAADQAAFTGSAASGDSDLGGLGAGMLIAALAMAAACAWGVYHRLAEYR